MDAALISCGAFVPLAVKWPLQSRRVSRITVKALVTSNIIQSVCLVGKGRLRERCGLETRTKFFFFFSLKKSAKTSADWIREYTVSISMTAFQCHTSYWFAVALRHLTRNLTLPTQNGATFGSRGLLWYEVTVQ